MHIISRFSIVSSMEGNFCDFRFALLHTNPPEKASLKRGRGGGGEGGGKFKKSRGDDYSILVYAQLQKGRKVAIHQEIMPL